MKFTSTQGSDMDQRLWFLKKDPAPDALLLSPILRVWIRVGGLRSFCLLTFSMELNLIHQEHSCVLPSMKAWVGLGLEWQSQLYFITRPVLQSMPVHRTYSKYRDKGVQNLMWTPLWSVTILEWDLFILDIPAIKINVTINPWDHSSIQFWPVTCFPLK